MAKPKILIIDNSIDVTGALKSITRTAYDLRDYYDFQFIVPSGTRGRFWIEGKGFFAIHEFRLKEISKRFSSWILYFPYLILNSLKLHRLINSQNISLIHVNDIYNLLPVVLRFFGNPVPYICHIRFLPNRFPPWLFDFWLRLHLRFAKEIIVVSNSVLNQLSTHPKLKLIYNELPVEERYATDRVYDGHTAPRFLYLSNFIAGKGQDYALQAFARIQHELPEWRLRFVGGDMGMNKNSEFKAQLMIQATQLGVEKKTEWHGFTEEVEKEYKLADIVLNFSESESFSITCLEALYFGRPVIATDCGGPAEIIEDRETGRIVENRNVEAMAAAMKELALNLPLRDKLGKNAKEVVRKRFSIESTSLKLKEVYDESLRK